MFEDILAIRLVGAGIRSVDTAIEAFGIVVAAGFGSGSRTSGHRSVLGHGMRIVDERSVSRAISFSVGLTLA